MATTSAGAPTSPRVEHIYLESDEIIVAETSHGARVGPVFSFKSPLRGCETELAVLEDHRLSVRSRRGRRPERRYVVDLRFVDGRPLAERHVAWRCWQVTVGLVALTAMAWLLAPVFEDPTWRQLIWQAATGLLTASVCVGMLALYRTRVTITYLSLHGRTRLFDINVGPGCARAVRSFVVEIARRTEGARVHTDRSPSQLLRDEMREHFRLWEAGILADEAYAASKQRILRAHG